MAKKKSWNINPDAAKSAAKTSIQKTSHTKPKGKVGRPKILESETIQVMIYVEQRDMLKKLAVLDNTTMTDYISDLVKREAKKKGIS